jgi:hypothetical protein
MVIEIEGAAAWHKHLRFELNELREACASDGFEPCQTSYMIGCLVGMGHSAAEAYQTLYAQKREIPEMEGNG